jgi:hypothetical protein
MLTEHQMHTQPLPFGHDSLLLKMCSSHDKSFLAKCFINYGFRGSLIMALEDMSHHQE